MGDNVEKTQKTKKRVNLINSENNKIYKKQNLVTLIDSENISHTKADKIKKIIKSQGNSIEIYIYAMQNDNATAKWHDEAKQNNWKEKRLSGEREKNKVDNKIIKDCMQSLENNKSADIFTICTSDNDYIPIIEELRKSSKKVILICEKKASDKLRKAASKVFEI